MTMTNFTGICTFPHGGIISAGLLFASCAALVATTYSVATCRIMVLSFASDTGNFEQSFSRFNPVQTESFRQYKVAIGLFQWLKSANDTNWDEGACVGYQQSMTAEFSDTYFEISRGAGSISVLLAILVVLWAICNSCIAWNMCQIIILCFVLLSGTIAASLSFIIAKSDLCNNIFQESSCTIDEGGLVLAAGAILWLSGFLVTALFMRTLDSRVDNYGLSELERARAREMALINEKRAREKERLHRKRAEERDRQLAKLSAVPSRDDGDNEQGELVTPKTLQSNSFDEDFHDERQEEPAAYSKEPRSEQAAQKPDIAVVEGDEEQDEYEVYINTRMQRIDEILRDIQDSDDLQPAEHRHAATSQKIFRGPDNSNDEDLRPPERYRSGGDERSEI